MLTNQIRRADVFSDRGDHRIYLGDNLDVLQSLPAEFADMVYLDPPFNTGAVRESYSHSGVTRFDDSFGDPADYVDWIRPRIMASIRALRHGGSIFVHCDPRTSHYLKVLLDQILGFESFVNEIIWKRHSGQNNARQGGRQFGRNSDRILYYGKGPRRVWHQPYLPYDQMYVDKTYCHTEAETGRRYALGDLTAPGGPAKGNPVFEFMGIVRQWRYSRAELQRLKNADLIVVTSDGNVPRRKRYLDEMPGRPAQSLWDDIASPPKKERVGYPTQKPVALLERLISCCTEPGDLILDPFCGAGTTLITAHRMGRRAIGIDSSEDAVRTAARRFEQGRGVDSAESAWDDGTPTVTPFAAVAPQVT